MGASTAPQKLRMVLRNNGFLGLDDPNPATRLSVKDGDISMPRTADNEWRSISALSDRGMLNISTNTPDRNVLIQMGAVNNGWRPGQIWYHSVSPQGHPAQMFLDWSHHTNNWVGIMRLVEDRGIPKVTIGDVSDLPGSDRYSLFVQRGILTEKIRVALSNDQQNWADYVFADDYALRPLSEVESFIKKNKHLPEIPSAEEVHKDGVDLAEMDAKLLQKIEELTLYVIEQQKEIERLKKRKR
jgi:hypothetical protein